LLLLEDKYSGYWKQLRDACKSNTPLPEPPQLLEPLYSRLRELVQKALDSPPTKPGQPRQRPWVAVNAYCLSKVCDTAVEGGVKAAVDDLKAIAKRCPIRAESCAVLIKALEDEAHPLHLLVDTFARVAQVHEASTAKDKQPYLWPLRSYASMGCTLLYKLYGWGPLHWAMDDLENLSICSAAGEWHVVFNGQPWGMACHGQQRIPPSFPIGNL
jgi:hypothetical protein